MLYVQLAFIIPSTIEKHNPGAKGSEGENDYTDPVLKGLIFYYGRVDLSHKDWKRCILKEQCR